MADNYFRVQEDIGNKINKSKSNFKKSPRDRISIGYIETRLEALEQHWTLFTDNHRKIVFEVRREELEKSSYIQNELYDQTEELYIDYKSTLKDALSKCKANTSSQIEMNKGIEQSSVKLPKISIPKFSGTYSEWVSFRDLFTSLIHSNNSIDNVQKLHYLKGSLTGEAEQLLRHIPITADNYLPCWEQLRNRYDNKKYLANNLLKRLTSQKVIASESSSAIKQLLDTTQECLQGLKNLEINISTWDIIIIFLVSNKLDSESRKQWEQKISDSVIELPTYDQFKDFLESRFRSLEFLNPKIQRQEKTSFTHVATNNLSCVFCKEGHKLFNCKSFAKQSVNARREFAQTHHLCFNCFSPHHSVYLCSTPTRCRLCKRKHHSLLHPLGGPQSPNSTPNCENVEESGDNTVVATLAASLSQDQGKVHIPAFTSVDSVQSQVLLATALVNVNCRNTSSFPLRALIDQGSQASFITESAVQLLGLHKMPENSIISGLGGDHDSNLRSKFSVSIEIQSRLDPTFRFNVRCHVLTKLTSFLPSKRFPVELFTALPPMILADPSFAVPGKIDLLLGAGVYSQIMLEGLRRVPPGRLLAQNTKLGWILSGDTPGDDSHREDNNFNVVISTHLIENENNLLKEESEPSSSQIRHLSEKEKKYGQVFTQTTMREESGRYVVNLPFKTDNPTDCDIVYDKSNFKDATLEEKKPAVKCHTICEMGEEEIMARFSSLQKLTRVLSICRRVTSWTKPDRKERMSKGLTAEEIRDTLRICINMCQRKYFAREIADLEGSSKIHKKSCLTPLSPFLDRDKILKVGGRLHNAHIDDDMKHPIIIPHKSHFTDLLISEAHSKTFHGGPQLMLNYLRSKYWVIGAKSLVRQFVRKCVTCIRHSARMNQQIMGQLPTPRVTAHRPLYKSGVDYAGPISVRCSKGRGQRSEKGFICLFVCMATRAIHLEVVSDLTTQGFLAAFKRFTARSGHIAELWSDNGTAFVGAAKELKLVFDAERSQIATEIADWLASNHTSWRFIPPHSPNFGGLWEAGIKSTKHHMKRVLNNTTLTFEELTTLLCQIEGCLNSRPLSQLSTSPDDPFPLTPSHFLVGEPIVAPPDYNYESTNVGLLRRWQLTQRMLQDFWRRWSQEYLTQLQNRYKWRDSCGDPKIDDVVLVKEDNLPPSRWLLGRIVSTHPGADGCTRVVSLKSNDKIIKRPLSKLVFLPVAE